MSEGEVNCEKKSSLDEPGEETNVEQNDEDNGSAPAARMKPAVGVSIQFKKPLLLVGPKKGANKFTKVRVSNILADEDESESNKETISEIIEEKNNENSSDLKPAKPISHKSPAEIIKENKIPVPYKEPKWSGLPPDSYSFEVLKSGTIVENINLNTRAFHVFGRLANCDIVMAHPTISRFHAVLQYRNEGDAEHPAGFYIYDLGSTHGTFLNKSKIKPNMYVRIQVGHMLKLGMSSRNFILQGPSEDEEPESELSVTELKEQRVKEKLAAELEERQRLEAEIAAEEQRQKDEEEAGIDWGMGEDADEETDLTENPFAATHNEELYINDPKKTLRGWFEREGYDLEYNCHEKGFGQFVCRIDLPVTVSRDMPTVAEATVRGKKKEAVIQCALEACRILDQYGLLRQSNHESKKRKAKNWEEDDYYDSDDDTFLDRTGTVEKKRQIRMEQAGVKGTTETHTYQSLMERLKKITEDILKIETELEKSTKKPLEDKVKDDNEDELDAYMNSLSSTEKSDKVNISKLKSQLSSLRQEEASVRHLANIAKPTELPKFNPSPQTSTTTIKQQKFPIIGKRKIPKKPLKVPLSRRVQPTVDNNSEEELDSE